MQTQNVVGGEITGINPFNFNVDGMLFNVKLIWNEECGGEICRKTGRGNPIELTWERACKWLHGLMHGIGKHWEHSKYLDAYIEPAECPRPWTPELLAAFQRELERDALRSLDAGIREGQLDPAFVRSEMAKIYPQEAADVIYIP